MPRAIDAHTHVFSATAPAVPGARYRPAYAATVERLRSEWDACGVSRGVIVQPSFFGADNREMLAAIARDPASLRGVAVADPGTACEELAALSRAGVRALRWNLTGVADYGAYARAEWRELLGRAAGAGLHLEVLVDPGRLPDIVAAIDGVPIAVVFDHFANPGRDAAAVERTFAAARALRDRHARPLHVKLSAPYRLHGANPAELALRWSELLPEHLVWGSDWPWTAHEEGRRFAALLEGPQRWLGADMARRILWDNAARLYGFD